MVINLGNEYDEKLRTDLMKILTENGAEIIEETWGVGGSQEIDTTSFKLGNDVISVVSETFIGLSISGPERVVEKIAELLSKGASTNANE